MADFPDGISGFVPGRSIDLEGQEIIEDTYLMALDSGNSGNFSFDTTPVGYVFYVTQIEISVPQSGMCLYQIERWIGANKTILSRGFFDFISKINIPVNSPYVAPAGSQIEVKVENDLDDNQTFFITIRGVMQKV